MVDKMLRRNWPLFIVITFVWSTGGYYYLLSLGINEGHLVYTLDDPYIHMAMAKNVAQHGVWGITKYGFSSSTSSLLWTGLLSLSFYIFGVKEITPLAMNLVFSSLLILAVYFILTGYHVHLPRIFIFLILISILFVTPLSSLALTGMEHILQALLAVIFTFLTARMLVNKSSGLLSNDSISLLLVSMLMTLTRYESMFMILPAVILFILRKRILFAITLTATSLIPIILYMFISISNGWLYLPNSVLLKTSERGTLPGITSMRGIVNLLGYSLVVNVTENALLVFPVVVILVMAIYLLIQRYISDRKLWEISQLMLCIFIVTTILHLEFASLGAGFRYEAYLLVLGLTVVSPPVYEYFSAGEWKRNILIVALLALTSAILMIPAKDKAVFVGYLIALALFTTSVLVVKKSPKDNFKKKYFQYYVVIISFLIIFLPSMDRYFRAMNIVPLGMSKTYKQQYQMGLFMNKYYDDQAVALNDIGVVNFLADIKCLDLVGLGSISVAEKRMDKTFNTNDIYEISKSMDVKIAVIYDQWFKGQISVPSQWVKVGEWKIMKDVVGDTVSFYAVDPSEKSRLTKNLEQFGPSLPEDVRQTIYSNQ